jgi:hypothetical protein
MGKLSGPFYPTDPKPYKDIQIFQVAEPDLPSTENSGTFDYHLKYQFDYLGKKFTYKFIPNCRKHVDGLKVVYYSVHNSTNQRTEYAVGPDYVDKFLDKVSLYYTAAVNFYGFFKSRPMYEVHTVRFQDKLMKGQVKAAFKALGQSWLSALQDPGWWASTASLVSVIPTKTAPKPAAVVNPAAPVVKSTATGASRLASTSANLLSKQVTRTTTTLTAPTVVRHSMGGKVPAITYNGIQTSGGLKVSTGGTAQFGTGAYAWPKNTQGVAPYVDIEIPAGVAVETITSGNQTFYRMMPAQGDVVPGKIVGTSLTNDQVAIAKKLAASATE